MDEAALCHKLPACARFFRALYAEAYRCRFSDGLRVLPGRVGLSLFGIHQAQGFQTAYFRLIVRQSDEAAVFVVDAEGFVVREAV